MNPRVVTPPTIPDLVAEAKGWLEVDGDRDDVKIKMTLEAVFQYLDGPEGHLGRCLAPQTLAYDLDDFGCQPIRLPYPPIVSVISVAYIDAGGESQVFADWDLRNDRVFTTYGNAWPAVQPSRGAITITYEAGRPELQAREKIVILSAAAALYANRESEAIAAGALTAVQNATVQRIVDSLRIPNI